MENGKQATIMTKEWETGNNHDEAADRTLLENTQIDAN